MNVITRDGISVNCYPVSLISFWKQDWSCFIISKNYKLTNLLQWWCANYSSSCNYLSIFHLNYLPKLWMKNNSLKLKNKQNKNAYDISWWTDALTWYISPNMLLCRPHKGILAPDQKATPSTKGQTINDVNSKGRSQKMRGNWKYKKVSKKFLHRYYPVLKNYPLSPKDDSVDVAS